MMGLSDVWSSGVLSMVSLSYFNFRDIQVVVRLRSHSVGNALSVSVLRLCVDELEIRLSIVSCSLCRKRL